MLKGLLLVHKPFVMTTVRVQRARVKTHAARHISLTRKADFGVDDGMAALSGLHELRVLLLEDREVALGVPVPDRVGGEEKVHFLERALVRLWVEGPHHRDGEDVARGKDVVRLLLERLKHDRAEQRKPAIADGPADHTPRVTFGAHLERKDLSWVEPWDGKPGGPKGCGEEKDHGHGTGAVTARGS